MKFFVRYNLLFKSLLLLTVLLFLTRMAAAKTLVFTSVLPQKYVVRKIAGDLVDIEVLVAPGMSPHTFEPTPQQMSRLSRAKAYFLIGVSFEKALVERLVKICPDLNLVDTAKDIPRRSMETFADDHHHGDDCRHADGAADPHVWLDPLLVVIQAEAVASALSEMLPEHAGQFKESLLKLKKELTDLDKHLATSLAPLKGETMLVFHPAFGYFTDRYGLRQQAVEIEGKEPGPRQLAALIRKCRKDGIRIVFVQKQFPVAAAQVIARAISGSVVQIDPLAEDYVVNLKAIAEAVLSGNKP